MSAGTVNLTIEQGATFSHRLIWQDANQNPIDLTGYTARMHVRAMPHLATPMLELDEVRLSRRALSATEIRQIYAMQKGAYGIQD